MYRSTLELLLFFFLGIVLKIALCLLSVWLAFLIWNWQIPAITGWTSITYWQALAFAVLFRLLTGSIRISFNKQETNNN